MSRMLICVIAVSLAAANVVAGDWQSLRLSGGAVGGVESDDLAMLAAPADTDDGALFKALGGLFAKGAPAEEIDLEGAFSGTSVMFGNSRPVPWSFVGGRVPLFAGSNGTEFRAAFGYGELSPDRESLLRASLASGKKAIVLDFPGATGGFKFSSGDKKYTGSFRKIGGYLIFEWKKVRSGNVDPVTIQYQYFPIKNK